MEEHKLLNRLVDSVQTHVLEQVEDLIVLSNYVSTLHSFVDLV